jgi:hypothetical protein
MPIRYPERYRVKFGPMPEDIGTFEVPHPKEPASFGVTTRTYPEGERVSVSFRRRDPNAEEMAFIRGLFFEPGDDVRVCTTEELRNAGGHGPSLCLHLWRATVPACKGECRQGRESCPHPFKCRDAA